MRAIRGVTNVRAISMILNGEEERSERDECTTFQARSSILTACRALRTVYIREYRVKTDTQTG